ncbi:MAG: hypothetical protein HYS12_16810 [Planctomycetes bacterium]|nr:hypothetical protein [Planctomycetota bacterium]
MDSNPDQDFLSALCLEALSDTGAGLRAILALLERHMRADVGKTVRWHLRSLSREDMEDVWQETLTEIWYSLRQGKVPRDRGVGAWIWTIAFHQAIDLLRRRRTRRKREWVVAISSETCQEGNSGTESTDQEE